MTPYYQDDAVTIYHGDCRDVMPTYAVDLIVTDPPYGIDYTSAPVNLGGVQYRPIIGDDTTELAEWVLNLTTRQSVVFGAHEFPHLLPRGGHLICWDKRLTVAADKMIGSPFELAWCSSPGANRMIRCLHGGVVNANGVGHKRLHPTEKPVPVLRRIISSCVEATVYDPFMGSGTTLRAAKDLGRKAIGIEIDERYCEVAAERMAQEVLDFGGAV